MSARSSEHPIIFAGPLVRAILSGQKTQTRRLINPQPAPFVQNTPDKRPPRHAEPYLDAYCGEKKTPANPRGMGRDWCWWTRDDRPGATVARCPYGVPRDRLWVRETWYPAFKRVVPHGKAPGSSGVIFRADYGFRPDLPATYDPANGWRPSIFMPRWASRLTLEVTDVRVQRLQDISEEDAIAEGAPLMGPTLSDEQRIVGGDHRTQGTHPHTMAFAVLWDTPNDERAPWISNPWVWAITFRRAA
jgi:hypothetical protein